MINYRLHGKAPYTVLFLHGGPGAAGEVIHPSEILSDEFGVIEPFQTKKSIKGQIQELKTIIEEQSEKPVQLIGWSWGAWLAFMFAAKYPEYISKLYLISSGPFESRFTTGIMKTRLERLNEDEQVELISMFETFDKSDLYLEAIIRLINYADSYKSNQEVENHIQFDYSIYKHIWKEAENLRKSGKLKELGKDIQCPVVAIHGDYDPHPYEGVVIPLMRVVEKFKYYILEKCGHHPWYEEHAEKDFFDILRKELHSP